MSIEKAGEVGVSERVDMLVGCMCRWVGVGWDGMAQQILHTFVLTYILHNTCGPTALSSEKRCKSATSTIYHCRTDSATARKHFHLYLHAALLTVQQGGKGSVKIN